MKPLVGASGTVHSRDRTALLSNSDMSDHGARAKPQARLRRPFFMRYTPSVAKELLGCRLVRILEHERLAGLIVETEAYRGQRDPASHAFRGRTKRNEIMFGQAGHAYVYFTMGAHFCLNITTELKETPAAVLIRAIEPVEGVGAMKRNRGLDDLNGLADGPGKLTKALGIDGDLNGEDIIRSTRLFLERGTKPTVILASSRVGISAGKSFKWRFFVQGSQFVSKAKPSA
ncbi:MAG TPA: DNA-3-methyladenine glycosylase [Nitrososphaerales archaeon]|nr:DNA-3-methyladenine glycosylase [Nitrososphaerales archaeon]